MRQSAAVQALAAVTGVAAGAAAMLGSGNAISTRSATRPGRPGQDPHQVGNRWHPDTGAWTYGEFELTSLDYNVAHRRPAIDRPIPSVGIGPRA